MSRHPHSTWTDQEVIEIIDLFIHGKWSYTEIGDAYGRTRCAVSGKLNRKGIARHGEATAKTGGTMNRAEARATRPSERKIRPKFVNILTDAQIGKLLQPEPTMPQVDDMCKWPVYEEQGVQMYCAAGIDPDGPRGRPYCRAHGADSTRRAPNKLPHRWDQTGEVDSRMTATQEEIERFMSFVDKLPSGCWFWTGARSRGKGNRKWYGSFWFRGRTIRAHRFSADYIGKFTPLPAGHHRSHSCDFSLCVCPGHVLHKDRGLNQQQQNERNAQLEFRL